MKLAVFALIGCIFVASVHSGAVLRKWPPEMEKALEKCSSSQNIEKDTAQQILSHIKPATTQNDKCLMSCFMTERGYLSDHKIKWEALLASHLARVSNPEVQDRMKQVFKMCEEKFVYEGKDDCQIAFDAYNCS